MARSYAISPRAFTARVRPDERGEPIVHLACSRLATHPAASQAGHARRPLTVAELPLASFSRITAEHRARPGERAFVVPFRGAFRLVADAHLRSVPLARPVGAYYAGSFHEQMLDGERLLFSATSKRARNDPDGVELYVVDLVSGDPSWIATVAGKQRFVEWHEAGGRLAILRTGQDARSGRTIDVYDVAAR